MKMFANNGLSALLLCTHLTKQRHCSLKLMEIFPNSNQFGPNLVTTHKVSKG